MRVFYSEHQAHYDSYTFDYAVYCEMEKLNELPAIYASGFLPYTGDLKIDEHIFYLARSLRVDLSKFIDSSENRRINRKIEPLNPSVEMIKKDTCDWVRDDDFMDFCSAYAAKRFHGGSMSKARFEYVLSKPIANVIFRFYNENEILGYVISCIQGDSLHYWYSFFNTEYLREFSLGKWMMWKVISLAKAQNLKYVYLGTCYGEKALYKIRDFKGTEYFNGAFWDKDIKKLKLLCKEDHAVRKQDIFKDQENKTAFLNQII